MRHTRIFGLQLKHVCTPSLPSLSGWFVRYLLSSKYSIRLELNDMRGVRREIKLKMAERSFCNVLKDLSSLTYSKTHNRVGLLAFITNYHWLLC
jgi:hypothetical protein